MLKIKSENNMFKNILKFKIKWSYSLIILLLIVIIGILSFALYVSIKRSELVIIPEKYYSTTTEGNKDIDYLTEKWVKDFFAQYEQKYVKKDIAIDGIQIKNIEILDENSKTVRIEFDLLKKKGDRENIARTFGGILLNEEPGKVICTWIVNLQTYDSYYEQKEVCMLTRRINQATYDVEQYNKSGQAEIDKEKNSFLSEKKYEDDNLMYTYKLEEGNIYLTYDKSITWNKVNIDLSKYIDSSTYKIGDGLYQISPEVTIISFVKSSNYIISYSNDSGKTFNEIKCSIAGTPMYIRFFDKNIGIMVLSGDVAMGHLETKIVKTNDAGKTWNLVSNGLENGDVRRGTTFNFLNDSVGYILEPTVNGESSTLYQTRDGYVTFSEVKVAPQVIDTDIYNDTSKWFKIYDSMELPKLRDNKLILLLNQGTDGDYMGGKIKASYESDDLGVTWKFIEEFEPQPEPWEG